MALDAKQGVILQSARITSGDETEITAREGQVAMLVSKDSEYRRKVSSDMGFFSWSSKDEGSTDETVQHTEINAAKGLTITTAEGVVVEYKETGNVKEDIAQLAQAPGLEWMAEIANRDDVDWRAVQEVHDQWSKSDSGVGGPGMQLVSLAMAVALSLTPGGQGVAGALMTTSTGQATAFGAWATSLGIKEGLSAAIAAGFNSLVMQAGMQVVGNGGDIGAALKALASMETVRSLATAMLTAGLTQGALDKFADSDLAGRIDGLTEELAKGAIKAGVNTGVGTAINGGDLGESMVANLRSSAVSVLGAEAAHEIGKAYMNGDGSLNYVTHKIAHAALGGTLAAANGEDIASGAIGGAVGEIVGEQFKPTAEDYEKLNSDLKKLWLAGEISYEEAENLAKAKVKEWMAIGVDVSKLAAGMAAVAIGGDVDAAANSAENAVENNVIFTAMIVAGALWAAYAAYEGDGNIVEGVKVIGAGNDTIAKLIESGVLAATEKTYEIAPEKTTWVINKLKSLGKSANAIITFTDEATGKVFSRTWDSLPEDTQQLILGSADGIITIATAGLGAVGSVGKSTFKASVVVTAKESGRLFDIIDDAYEASQLAKAAEKAASALADAEKVAAQVGDDVTKVVGKVVVDNMPTQLERLTTSGVELVAKPGKTTTVLGRYTEDMQDIIRELDYPKTLDFEAKPGGFNVLNAPDELYKNSDQFWKEYNKPFLEAAIERGDDIVLATKPDPIFFDLTRQSASGFKSEIKHLLKKRYKFDESTMKMIIK